MTGAETRALSRAAVVLVLISAVRFGTEARRGGPLFTPDSTDVLPALAEAVAEERSDQERRSKPLGPEERLDPNTASEADLDRLPGVGAATARAIILERTSNGGFHSLDDLVRVRGIGPATIERIRPHVEISGIPTALRRRRPADGIRPTGNTGLIDINRADSAALLRLSGIGPSLAGRIIEYRNQHGPFRRTEDLLNVRGIGPVTMSKLVHHVTVSR